MAGKFSIEAVFSAKDGTSRIIGQIETRFSRMASGVGSSLKSLDKFTSGLVGQMADLAKQTAAVGLVVGGIAAGAFMHVAHAGMEFEQSITNVGAVMGKTRGQVGDLEKEAMRLGVATQFSAIQVSEGMEMMARKGFDSQEILQGIPGVLNAVAVSGENMGEVATVVGSSIRGFGLEAAQAGHVADVLAFAAEKTGAKILDMGTALSTAAPTAKQLGVSIEDTAAAVGLLQKLGIDASTAGTATATMLAKISKPSKEAAQEMANMGLKFQDAKGNMLPFRDVLGQFVKAGEKTGGNMKTMAFFAELVGLRGDKAALGLKEMAKSGEFDRLANGLRTVDGYAQKVADIKLDTTLGSWKLLNSTIEVLETKLFSLRGGALKGVIDGANQWLQANDALIRTKVAEYLENISFAADAFGKNAKRGFLQAKSFIDPLLTPLEKLAGHMGGFATWPENVRALGRAFGWMGVIIPAFLAFTVAVKLARGAVIAFEVAQKVLSATVWIANAALTAYRFVTDGSAASTVLLTVATKAGRLASIASTIAMGARNAVTYIAFVATTRFTVAQVASKIATWAMTAATWLSNTATGAWTAVLSAAGIAQVAYKAETEATTAATEAATIATDLANLSMGTFLITVGLAAAAVAALMVAWDQWGKLSKEAETEGGVWNALTTAVGNQLATGTASVGATASTPDQYDASVGAQYGQTPQMATPQERAASSVRDLIGGDGTVTIRDESGRAAISQQPKSGFSLKMAPSGTP